MRPRGPIARAIRNAGWLLGGKGVGGLLLVWAAAELAATLAMWIAAWHELRRRGLHTRAVVTPRGVVGENLGLWHFAWATKFSSSISALWYRLLVLACLAWLAWSVAGAWPRAGTAPAG